MKSHRIFLVTPEKKTTHFRKKNTTENKNRCSKLKRIYRYHNVAEK